MNNYKPYSLLRNIMIHTIVWIIVVQFLFDFTGLYYSFSELFIEGIKDVDDAFIITPLFITLFYWNLEFLIPKILDKTTWWKYLLALIISYFCFIFIAYGIYIFIESQGYTVRLEFLDYLDMFSIFSLIVLGISSSIGIYRIANKDRNLKSEALVKQKEAEIKYLKAQVNPHFLFNTLNSIYALSASEEATQTTEAILKLSEIMRYPLKDGSQEIVPLSNEIAFISDYIDFQKIRLGEEYPIHFEVKGEIKQLKIAPLLFISFIENAFKYGISQKHPSPIHISIHVLNNKINFQSSNAIIHQKDIESHELGLQNVVSRLDLLYTNKYKLDINHTKDSYQVKLQLEII